jgi:hypothetical protein
VPLTRSDAVIALGKQLMVVLQAKDDLLGGWMAHHLATLITAAETALPEKRAEACAACSAAVLEIWRHRNTLPPHMRPLGELEPILTTLASLSVDPDSFRYHAPTLRSAILAKTEGATKQWLELALGLDYSARMLIGAALRAAAASTQNSAEDWVELARQAAGDEGPEAALLGFLDPDFNAQEAEASRQQRDIKDQVRRLRSFAELANAHADHIESQLDSSTKG